MVLKISLTMKSDTSNSNLSMLFFYLLEILVALLTTHEVVQENLPVLEGRVKRGVYGLEYSGESDKARARTHIHTHACAHTHTLEISEL